MPIDMNTTLRALGIVTDVVIPWRESSRKRASKYKDAYTGFTRDSYAYALDDVPLVSVVEQMTRSTGHMYNNEVISAIGRAIEKANKDNAPIGDEFKWVHDRRMEMRSKILEGKLGTRSAARVQEVDEVTREVQNLCLMRLARIIAGQRGLELEAVFESGFPREYNNTNGKYIVQGDRTLADMVAQLIAGDAKGVMRAKAQATVDQRRAERAAAAAAEDDDEAAALFDEDDEEEEDAA